MYKTTLLPPESQHKPPSPPSWFILMFQRMHTHTHSPIRKPPLQSPLSSHTHTSAPLPLRCIQSVATGGGAAHTVNPSSRGLRLGRDPEITGLASWRTVHAVILFYTATQVKCCSDKGSSNQTGGLLFISPGSCARHVPESRNKNQSIHQLIGFIFPVRSQKETPALLCPVQTAAPERRWRHIRTEPPPPMWQAWLGRGMLGMRWKTRPHALLCSGPVSALSPVVVTLLTTSDYTVITTTARWWLEHTESGNVNEWQAKWNSFHASSWTPIAKLALKKGLWGLKYFD